MLGRYLKDKFNIGKDKDVPEAEQFYSPLRISLHSTISLNTVDLLVLQGQLHEKFVLPKSALTVMAIGVIKRDDMTMYRVYANDESDSGFVLQLACSPNHHSGEEEVGEIILFKQIATVLPETQDGWDELLVDVGLRTFEVDEIVYDRIWGGDDADHSELIDFAEHIVEPNKTNEYNDHYMMYSRTFKNQIGGNDVEEFILAGVEEDANSAEFSIQVGIALTPTDVQIQ